METQLESLEKNKFSPNLFQQGNSGTNGTKVKRLKQYLEGPTKKARELIIVKLEGKNVLEGCKRRPTSEMENIFCKPKIGYFYIIFYFMISNL